MQGNPARPPTQDAPSVFEQVKELCDFFRGPWIKLGRRQLAKELDRVLRPIRRREDGTRVVIQNCKPGRDVLRMIRTRLVGNTEACAQERRAQFRDQLLKRIGFIAKALAKSRSSRCLAPVQ